MTVVGTLQIEVDAMTTHAKIGISVKCFFSISDYEYLQLILFTICMTFQ